VLHIKPKRGSSAGATTVTAAKIGETRMLYGDRAVFTFYSFSAAIPVDIGMSSFDVEIIDAGVSQTHDNGGSGFPLGDGVIHLEDRSCHSHFGDSPDTTIVGMAAVCPSRRSALNISLISSFLLSPH